VLIGLATELHAGAVLTTQVSPHARRAVAEADAARRLMYAARSLGSLPKGLMDSLMTVHARKPHPDTPQEIAATAQAIRDPNFRVQVAEDGVHVYNRDGHHVLTDAMSAFPKLKLETDGAHAFYMGAELARAELAWQLGKRYVQDQPLDWGCALPARQDNLDAWCAPGPTMNKPKPS
jgi:dihydropteroate synthase